MTTHLQHCTYHSEPTEVQINRYGELCNTAGRLCATTEPGVYIQDPRDLYTFIRVVGSGSYATVFLARSNLTQQVVAIKIIQFAKDPPSEGELKAIDKELDILQIIAGGHTMMSLEQLCSPISQPSSSSSSSTTTTRSTAHLVPTTQLTTVSPICPYVVKYLESYRFQKQVWVVMEYSEFGSLEYFLQNVHPTGALCEFNASSLAKQLLLALVHLHSLNIIHRDFKTANILISHDGTLKVSDFGLSEVNKVTTTGLCGTPYYLAPEVCAGQLYDNLVDVWSLGQILYFALSGGVGSFLTQYSPPQLIKFLAHENSYTHFSLPGKPQPSYTWTRTSERDLSPLNLPRNQHWDPATIDFLRCCFAPRTKRWSPAELLLHTYVYRVPRTFSPQISELLIEFEGVVDKLLNEKGGETIVKYCQHQNDVHTNAQKILSTQLELRVYYLRYLQDQQRKKEETMQQQFQQQQQSTTQITNGGISTHLNMNTSSTPGTLQQLELFQNAPSHHHLQQTPSSIVPNMNDSHNGPNTALATDPILMSARTTTTPVTSHPSSLYIPNQSVLKSQPQPCPPFNNQQAISYIQPTPLHSSYNIPSPHSLHHLSTPTANIWHYQPSYPSPAPTIFPTDLFNRHSIGSTAPLLSPSHINYTPSGYHHGYFGTPVHSMAATPLHGQGGGTLSPQSITTFCLNNGTSPSQQQSQYLQQQQQQQQQQLHSCQSSQSTVVINSLKAGSPIENNLQFISNASLSTLDHQMIHQNSTTEAAMKLRDQHIQAQAMATASNYHPHQTQHFQYNQQPPSQQQLPHPSQQQQQQHQQQHQQWSYKMQLLPQPPTLSYQSSGGVAPLESFQQHPQNLIIPNGNQNSYVSNGNQLNNHIEMNNINYQQYNYIQQRQNYQLQQQQLQQQPYAHAFSASFYKNPSNCFPHFVQNGYQHGPTISSTTTVYFNPSNSAELLHNNNGSSEQEHNGKKNQYFNPYFQHIPSPYHAFMSSVPSNFININPYEITETAQTSLPMSNSNSNINTNNHDVNNHNIINISSPASKQTNYVINPVSIASIPLALPSQPTSSPSNSTSIKGITWAEEFILTLRYLHHIFYSSQFHLDCSADLLPTLQSSLTSRGQIVTYLQSVNETRTKKLISSSSSSSSSSTTPLFPVLIPFQSPITHKLFPILSTTIPQNQFLFTNQAQTSSSSSVHSSSSVLTCPLCQTSSCSYVTQKTRLCPTFVQLYLHLADDNGTGATQIFAITLIPEKPMTFSNKYRVTKQDMNTRLTTDCCLRYTRGYNDFAVEYFVKESLSKKANSASMSTFVAQWNNPSSSLHLSQSNPHMGAKPHHVQISSPQTSVQSLWIKSLLLDCERGYLVDKLYKDGKSTSMTDHRTVTSPAGLAQCFSLPQNLSNNILTPFGNSQPCLLLDRSTIIPHISHLRFSSDLANIMKTVETYRIGLLSERR